jgi:hypothetical protein
MHPTQIENAINLAGQVVRWHHLVEIKRIEELDLAIFPPAHHAPLPMIRRSNNGITPGESSQREFCNTINP